MSDRVYCDSSSSDNDQQLELPSQKIIDKVYIFIGFGICASGSITIIVICILIYFDNYKNSKLKLGYFS